MANIVIDAGHGGISLTQNVEWLWMRANTKLNIFFVQHCSLP